MAFGRTSAMPRGDQLFHVNGRKLGWPLHDNGLLVFLAPGNRSRTLAVSVAKHMQRIFDCRAAYILSISTIRLTPVRRFIFQGSMSPFV